LRVRGQKQLPTGLSIRVQETSLIGCNLFAAAIPGIYVSSLSALDCIRTRGAVSLLKFFSRAHRLDVRDAIHGENSVQVIDLMLQQFERLRTSPARISCHSPLKS